MMGDEVKVSFCPKCESYDVKYVFVRNQGFLLASFVGEVRGW